MFYRYKIESKHVNNVKAIADYKEAPICVMDGLPPEIIMTIVKMLPNFEDRMAFGLTSQRYWDIMIQSRYPGDPSLQLIKNHALAKKALNWIETRRFVSMVAYDKSRFVFIMLDLELETNLFNLPIYVNRDSTHYPLFENHSSEPTRFRINN